MRRLIAIGLIAVMGLAAWAAQNLPEGSRMQQWKQVDDALQKGLPRTAIEKLDPIIASAKKDEAWAEAIRAVGLKIALEGNIQGNKPEEKIDRMRQAVADSPPAMKPVMHAILAHWYWHYFQHNRWRIMQRTETAVDPGDDVTAWSLPRIVQEVDRQFQQALSQAEALKKTPIADYKDLLDQGTMPAAYRPTMYDFLVYEAINFYTLGETAVTQPEDAFVLEAEAAIFDPSERFLAWEVKGNADSFIVKAIKLYQELLRLHANDQDRGAYLSADLERLTFGYNQAVGEAKDDRYVAALKRFAEGHREHALASLAYYRWAEVLRGNNELVDAHEFAIQGKNLHADSPGGKLCHNLIEQIEARSFFVAAERVWNAPWPSIEVQYRNIDRLHLRVVKASWSQHSQSNPDRQRLMLLTPVKSWSERLPATDDYQQRTHQIAAPENFKPGFYFLIASYRDDFGTSDNMVQFAPFWVSELSLVVRQEHGEAGLGGLVTHALTGQPLPGATVQFWQYQPRGNQWTRGEQVQTDKDGLFNVNFGRNQARQAAIHVHWKGQELATEHAFYTQYYDQTPRPSEGTVFFTDRALYRPGQTIHYKGLSYRTDHNAANYEVLTRKDVTVVFNDPNGKEIARKQHQTNDYGTFNGSFTAPSDRLMGSMRIRVDGAPSGSTTVTVEEYKRPKFEVELDPAKEAPRLGDDVLLAGTAKAYTGAPIDGAQVRYRVVREVRFPPWWFWWRGWQPQQPQQEIAHGTAKTDRDGRFEVTFTAVPDRTVPEESEPIFVYNVMADVTDNSGETRSASRQIQVGYTALQATLSADDWQTVDEPVKLTIKTSSFDGEGRAAEGKVKIHRLQAPDKVHRAPLSTHPPHVFVQVRRPRPGDENGDSPDLSDPANWPLGEVVAEKPFKTGESGTAELSFDLEGGAYQAVLETEDRFGKPVKGRLPITVLDLAADQLSLKVPFLLALRKSSVDPGEEFVALWGSGYEKAQAYVEIERERKVVQAFWTKPGATQAKVTLPVTEKLRGGFTLRVTMIRENRAYIRSHHVDVPWTNKQLTVAWERFTSKLLPGQEETWTAVISGPDAQRAAAEMVAALYDASLDAYLPHEWMKRLNVFYQDSSRLNSVFQNRLVYFNLPRGNFKSDLKPVDIRYPSLPSEIVANLYGFGFPGRGPMGGAELQMRAKNADGVLAGAPPAPSAAQAMLSDEKAFAGEGIGGGAAEGPDLSAVAPRTNLAETAFFFPHLASDEDGTVRISFTMPEALTEWKFMAFAHDKALRSGSLHDRVVTSKDLMVEPNPPRFVREGDTLEFVVKVTNRSPQPQQGQLRLTFSDARTNDAVNEALGIEAAEQPFDVPAGESRSYSWKMSVPSGAGYLIYRAVGSTGKLSDGEEGFLPVLSRRILVTESLPLPIRGEQTRQFRFDHLLASGDSDTLEHQALTVEMASNPAWYAVMALPYLMEYPHQCSEQIFNRMYANALARHIVQSYPKIRRVFDQWRGTPALDSPLLKNQDLKNVMVEETPWLRQAQNESQARRNVAILFDDNRLNEELRRAAFQLEQMQYDDGAWPWFPSGPGNDYITLYIVTGYGRLRHLGVEVNTAPAVKALSRLDSWIDRTYHQILKRAERDPEVLGKNHVNSTIALYLYGRSFFLQDQQVDANHRDAFDYFVNQAKEHWLEVGIRQSQGHLAIALNRLGHRESAQAIVKSLRERAVQHEELGMFWRELEISWWWFRAPIETHALMIEVFEEVAADVQAVQDLQVWLLKQKQTQDWKTTKATADAVYALLLRGVDDLLASDELVEVTLGDVTIEPENVEAGTGYYKQRFAGSEVKPNLGQITVQKLDPGVAWGGVHWQYFEDIDKVPAYEGTPLTIRKALYTKEHTPEGPQLDPVEGELEVGQELVVRIEIRVDRDMEYVHLKDQRGSGTEPVDVLSKYHFRDGLAYYQSTRDTASHFFIDYLPKGTYVFEYSTWVVHRGQYTSGIASIECMYAPEFNSHSGSTTLKVK